MDSCLIGKCYLLHVLQTCQSFVTKVTPQPSSLARIIPPRITTLFDIQKRKDDY